MGDLVKVAIYARVSTKDQTCENQILRLKTYCERFDLSFTLFQEVESSRKTRPVKYDLFQRLRNNEFEQVIVWKLDRWARSSQELIMEITELYKRGVVFISLSDNIDLSTATGKLQFQILSAFAEFERSLISERTKEGLHRAKSQGKSLGRPKGSKDKKVRRKSGYFVRDARKLQKVDEANGLFRPLEFYLDNPPPKK